MIPKPQAFFKNRNGTVSHGLIVVYCQLAVGVVDPAVDSPSFAWIGPVDHG